jgi:hypothetical protein
MSVESLEEDILVQQDNTIIASEEEDLGTVCHWTYIVKKAETGKLKGKEVNHFQCNYCPKSFQCPSNGTIKKHLRNKHPTKCPELLPKEVRNLLVNSLNQAK